MKDTITFSTAKNAVTDFINNEFGELFPKKLYLQFLNFFSSLSTYEEEGYKLHPNIIFTNNIELIAKNTDQFYKIPMFSDDISEIKFNYNIRRLAPFCKNDWLIYVEIKDDSIDYGICNTFNSIKEPSLKNLILTNNQLIDKNDRVKIIYVEPLTNFTINLTRLNGDILSINNTLDDTIVNDWQTEIREFVNASFSKLRTTQKKLNQIKTMYENVFDLVFKNVHGALCVIIDKDYVDNGFFQDGVWLKEPISFSKLFLHATSYSESKLTGICDLFMDMLDYDGITIVDNTGTIRAYNVFVENNAKSQNVIGGARKRAAYTIINSRRKHIIGVYFQSHEGEAFYNPVKK